MSGDVELRYLHRSKSKRDTPALRANRAAASQQLCILPRGLEECDVARI
jgi:hypothetical protein